MIIYPNDSTTSFLLESFYFLQKKTKAVTFFEIQPNNESHSECNLLITKFETIIFMGHGSFQKLSGARNEFYFKDYLISIKEILNLEKKNWILFSCNSNQLLKKCSSNIKYGIGFGDLPTDFNDISGVREFDAGAYLNITDNAISEFKNSLNWLISKSILKLVEERNSGADLYHFIRLLITRRMVDVLKDPRNSDQREHAKLLFDMKRDSILIDNFY